MYKHIPNKKNSQQKLK